MEFTANSDNDVDENLFYRIFRSIFEIYNVQFYDSNSFKVLSKSASTEDLSVVHLNNRSIRVNCDAFLSFLSNLDLKMYVISFTESNLEKGDQAGEYLKS